MWLQSDVVNAPHLWAIVCKLPFISTLSIANTFDNTFYAIQGLMRELLKKNYYIPLSRHKIWSQAHEYFISIGTITLHCGKGLLNMIGFKIWLGI
jgi:hypothetical protein